MTKYCFCDLDEGLTNLSKVHVCFLLTNLTCLEPRLMFNYHCIPICNTKNEKKKCPFISENCLKFVQLLPFNDNCNKNDCTSNTLHFQSNFKIVFEFVKMLVYGLKVAFLVIVVKKKKSVIRGANKLYCF